jgi:hypothetical protein
MSMSADRQRLACTLCTTLVEYCAFCDRDECPVIVCYKCLRIDLRQAVSEPHTHGG